MIWKYYGYCLNPRKLGLLGIVPIIQGEAAKLKVNIESSELTGILAYMASFSYYTLWYWWVRCTLPYSRTVADHEPK